MVRLLLLKEEFKEQVTVKEQNEKFSFTYRLLHKSQNSFLYLLVQKCHLLDEVSHLVGYCSNIHK